MPFYDHITPEQAALIRESRVFFIASAAPDIQPGPDGEGPVNLSPKGNVPLHILDDHTVAYLDFPGSGNETARHASAGAPATIMLMSVTAADAAIVRLYGRTRVIPMADIPADSPLRQTVSGSSPRLRQVIMLAVEQTQTSCGYGVPVFEYVEERGKINRGRRYKEPRA